MVAVVAAVATLPVRAALEPLGGILAVWLCAILAVVVSAWYGGMKPGLLTTGLVLFGAVSRSAALRPPEGPAAGLLVWAALLFTLTAVAICAAMQRLRMEQFRAKAAGERLHDVLESTQDAILSVDNEFRCLYANARAGQLAKKPPAMLHGKSLRTVFPETPAILIYKELQRALREQTPVHFEDGIEQTRRWYEFDAYPAPQGLNLFVRDVTARKVAEVHRASVVRTLESEHLRLESVLREMPVGVIISSVDMRAELVNPAATNLFGATLAPGDDLTAARRGTLQTPDGDVIDPHAWPIRRTLQTGEPVRNQEAEYVRPDGTALSVVISAIPLTGADGRIRAALATFTDVTSIRQMQKALTASEARLRRLFDSPIIGVVSGDEERLLEANDAYLNMLGYTREELTNGEVKWAGMTPDEYLDADANAARQLRERGFCDPIEKEIFAKDGRRVPVLAGSAAYDKGSWSPWISWVLDLSARRKLENRLREAARLESIGLLAGGVAHDFNNILTSVLGNASLALESLPAGHCAHALIENTIRSTERAAHLTRQLLAYAGKSRLVMRPVDISALTDEIGHLIRTSIPRRLELELSLAPGLPFVDGDATQIQQLIMNLAINGAEAIGDEAGKVRVVTQVLRPDEEWLRAEELDSDIAPGEYVAIRVEDNGCGMDSETQKRIFDPFFTTKFTGRGLGLAAAIGVVRAHKGAIKVASAPRQGSTFLVLLPVSPVLLPVWKEPAREFHEPRVPAAPLARGAGTILVVDDEEIVRDVARSTLENCGYTVLAASNGYEAVELYRGVASTVSMIVLDVTMPKMSGAETLRRLAVVNPAARVLLISGFGEDEAMRDFAGQRLAGFIQKPFTAARLATKVREILAAAQPAVRE